MHAESPSHRRRWIAPAVVIVVAVIVVAFTGRSAPTSGNLVPSATSTDPQAWILPGLRGGTIRLDQFRGRPTVVNFYASWCDPCRAELPRFAGAAAALRGQVNFAAVNSEETGNGLAMAQQYGIGDWPLARDIGGAADSGLHDALGETGMPATAFYDSRGHLLFVAPGELTTAALDADLSRLYGIRTP